MKLDDLADRLTEIRDLIQVNPGLAGLAYADLLDGDAATLPMLIHAKLVMTGVAFSINSNPAILVDKLGVLISEIRERAKAKEGGEG